MFILNFIVGILRSMGLIVSLALLVWGILGVRGCCRSLFPKDRFVGNMTSVIEEIRSVSKLKVLRVVDAGLDTYPSLDNEDVRREGFVDFQYSGILDLYVDMSKMEVEISPSNTFVITLAAIEKTPVRELVLTRNLPLDSSDKLSIEPYRKFYGSVLVQDNLFNEFANIQANSVKKSAGNEANVTRAKRQAERLIRCMLAPFVDNADKDIMFKWASESVKEQ